MFAVSFVHSHPDSVLIRGTYSYTVASIIQKSLKTWRLKADFKKSVHVTFTTSRNSSPAVCEKCLMKPS